MLVDPATPGARSLVPPYKLPVTPRRPDHAMDTINPRVHACPAACVAEDGRGPIERFVLVRHVWQPHDGHRNHVEYAQRLWQQHCDGQRSPKRCPGYPKPERFGRWGWPGPATRQFHRCQYSSNGLAELCRRGTGRLDNGWPDGWRQLWRRRNGRRNGRWLWRRLRRWASYWAGADESHQHARASSGADHLDLGARTAAAGRIVAGCQFWYCGAPCGDAGAALE